MSFVSHRKSYKVSGIRGYMTEELIRSRFLYYAPDFKGVNFSVVFLYSTPEFQETDQSITVQRDNLDTFLSQCAPRNSYYISLLRPRSSKKVFYRAFVCFSDPTVCWRMFQHFQGGSDDLLDSDDDVDDFDIDSADAVGSTDSRHRPATVYKEPFRVELSLSSSVRYTEQIFSVIKPSVDKITRCFSSTATKIEVKCDRWKNTHVKITTNDNFIFRRFQRALSKAVEPEIITFAETKESKYASTLGFQKIMKEIQAKTSTYIKVSCSSLTASTVAIYGPKENREASKAEINLHVQAILHGTTECYEFEMKNEKPGLMKHLVEKYGPDAADITDTFDGITATKLIPRKQVLTLFATEAGYQSFLESVKSYKPAEDIAQAEAPDTAAVSSSSECCVCGESHSTKEKKTFFYRLEYCGHVYCKECIEQQLQPNSIRFPVTCAAENCEKPLVWKDFDNLFQEKVKNLREITSPSLQSYIEKNDDKVHNCLTPDCRMIYVVSETGQRFICRHCGANICTKCHATWHEGFNTCGAYKKHKELADWMREDPSNRKLCPNCSAPIEKNGGCQHVACTKCEKHICWHCLKFFESNEECYGHLRKEHGGVF